MDIAIWVILGLIYFIISSILVYMRRYEEDWEGGVNMTAFNNVMLYLFWPIVIICYVIIAPFYGLYKLVFFIGDKLTKE